MVTSSQRRRAFAPGSRDRRIISAAADLRGGSIAELAQRAGLSEKTVRQRLCVMRATGFAAWESIHVPAAVGRPIETRSYVRLQSVDLDLLRTFENRCRSDPAVASAALTTGGSDYVLDGFFETVRDASVWALQLRLEPNVQSVRQVLIETRFGHGMRGAPWR